MIEGKEEAILKTVIEEFGGTIIYVIAGGGMLGIFVYLLELLLA